MAGRARRRRPRQRAAHRRHAGPLSGGDPVRIEPVGVARARRIVAGDLGVVSAAPGWPHADTFDALRPYAEHGSDDVGGTFLVVEAETGRVVGECGWYGPPGDDGEVEIGYGLASHSRGRGYGTAAVRLLLDWVGRQPGVRVVTAEVETGNEPSRRLLLRLGFAEEGTRGTLVRYARRAGSAGITDSG